MRYSLLIVLALCACAKVSPPGGGPIDRTSPRVVSTQPAADATGVATDRVIFIDFSEPMDRKSTGEAIFVTPASTLSTVWEGDTRLRLILESGLAVDRTYVVTLGTDARDLRKNRIEEAFQFAFSTGAALDQGMMVGRIVDLQGPRRGVTVWAYDMDHFSGSVGVDAPAYVTQTGSDGRFRFERLAATRYRLMGFDDEDRDRQVGDGEARALGSLDVNVADTDSTQAGDLHLFTPASQPQLTRISAIDQQRLLFVFDREVDVAVLEIEIAGLPILGVHAAPDDLSRIHVRTERQEPGKAYHPRIRLAGESIDVDEPVRGSSREDTRAPEVVQVAPTNPAIELSQLVITFDEAMMPHTPGTDFWLAVDSTVVPRGTWSWPEELRLVYELESPVGQGKLALRGRWAEVTDLAGNLPTDTLDVEIEVLAETDHPSLEGDIRLRVGIDPATIRIIADAAHGSHLLSVDDGVLRAKRLSPGTYQVYGYADLDGDEAHDPGALAPYRAAEPFGWLGSIELRASTTTHADPANRRPPRRRCRPALRRQPAWRSVGPGSRARRRAGSAGRGAGRAARRSSAAVPGSSPRWRRACRRAAAGTGARPAARATAAEPMRGPRTPPPR